MWSNYRTKAIYSRELLYKWKLLQIATLSRNEAEQRRQRFIVTILTSKLLLIAAVSLFIWALGGASVQVAGYVCVCILWCWLSAGGAVAECGLCQPCSGSVYRIR